MRINVDSTTTPMWFSSRSSQTATADAAPTPHYAPLYSSPAISLDRETGIAVLQLRDPMTGSVIMQIPSASVAREYRENAAKIQQALLNPVGSDAAAKTVEQGNSSNAAGQQTAGQKSAEQKTAPQSASGPQGTPDTAQQTAAVQVTVAAVAPPVATTGGAQGYNASGSPTGTSTPAVTTAGTSPVASSGSSPSISVNA